jgi:hypothetical protein
MLHDKLEKIAIDPNVYVNVTSLDILGNNKCENENVCVNVTYYKRRKKWEQMFM